MTRLEQIRDFIGKELRSFVNDAVRPAQPPPTAPDEGKLIERAAHPAEELFLLRLAGLFLFLRRHLAVEDLVDDVFPDIRFVGDVRGLEIEFALLLLGRVAVEAILVQHGLNGLLKGLLLIGKK